MVLGSPPLPATVAVRAGTVRVGPDVDDSVIFDLHLQSAGEYAHGTLRFFPLTQKLSPLIEIFISAAGNRWCGRTELLTFILI